MSNLTFRQRPALIQDNFTDSTTKATSTTALNGALDALRFVNGPFALFRPGQPTVGYSTQNAALSALAAINDANGGLLWARVDVTQFVDIPLNCTFYAPGKKITVGTGTHAVRMGANSAITANSISRNGVGNGDAINISGGGVITVDVPSISNSRGNGVFCGSSVCTVNGDINVNTAASSGFVSGTSSGVIGAAVYLGGSMTINGKVSVNTDIVASEGVAVGTGNTERMVVNGEIIIGNKGFIARNQNGILVLNSNCSSSDEGVKLFNGRTILSCRIDTTLSNKSPLQLTTNGNATSNDYFRLSPGHALISNPGISSVINLNNSVTQVLEVEGELVASGAVGSDITVVRKTLATGSGAVTRTFSQVLTLDVPAQYQRTTQTGDLLFSIAANPTENSSAVVELVCDGTHAVTFDPTTLPEAAIFGAVSTDPSQVNVLSFFCGTPAYGAWLRISSRPKAGVADTTAPTVTSASVASGSPTLLRVVYSEVILTPGILASDFTVSGNTVTGVAVSGGTLTLTLGTPVASGATLTVSGGNGKVRDAAGNVAANLSNQAVVNNVAATTVAYVFGGSSGSPATAQNITLANDTALLALAGTGMNIAYYSQFTSATDARFILSRGSDTIRAWETISSAAAGNAGSGFYMTDANGVQVSWVAQGIASATAKTYLEWNIADGTITSASVTLRVNGTLTALTFSDGGGGFAGVASGGNIRIGRLQTADSWATKLDELVIAKALTSGESALRYPGGGTIVSDPRSLAWNAAKTLAYLPFDNNLNDVVGNHNGTATTPQYA